MYEIGFYNEKVDNKNNLKECNIIIFNDFEKLKSHIRKEDRKILASDFSLFDIEITEVLNLMSEYNITILIYGMNSNSKAMEKFKIQTLLATMQYIKENLDIIHILTKEEV